MLKWLTQWLRSLRQPDRDIFQYWDGRRQRAIDPIKAWQALHDHPQYDDQRHPKGVDRGDQEAIDITCQAVRDVFGVAPYDAEAQQGLTVLETLSLLAMFYGYLDLLKKTPEPAPTSPSSSAATSGASGKPTTNSTSGSG